MRQAIANANRLTREADARRKAESLARDARARAARAAERRIDHVADFEEQARAMALPAWNTSPKTWRRWLSRQIGRLDAVGAFARRIQDDAMFPFLPSQVLEHLTACLAEPEVFAAAQQALNEWVEYLRNEIAREVRDVAGRNPEYAETIRERHAESLKILEEILG
jgi:hypothetical protein